MGKSRVSIVRCSSYKEKKVYDAVKKALSLMNFRFRKGMTVLLKPNIISPKKPELAVTTHPAVVDAVCRILRENNCKIAIGESDGAGTTKKGFEVSGIGKVAKKYRAKTIVFETDAKVKVKNRKNLVLKEFFVAKTLKDADLVINLPKLKTHSLTKYTGAVKNVFGVIPGATKTLYHKKAPDVNRFSHLLLDIYQSVKPQLNIMDAIVGMEGLGPGAGTPKKTGYIIASRDGVALDFVASKLAGFVPETIRTIDYAFKRGISKKDDIEIFGKDGKINDDKLKGMIVPYKKAPETNYTLMAFGQWVFALLSPRPEVSKEKCTGCMVCVKHCPVKAISFKKYPQIDRKKCIKCFCCAELCAYGAMNVEGPRMLEILKKALGIIRRRKRKK